jgi:uncharacterized protein
VASRLLEYEVWVRVHARELARSHGDAARLLLARISFVEMQAPVLARALHPFPAPLRTLDAIHLATVVFLMEHGHDARLASYDEGMLRAAEAMGIRGVAMP